MSEKIRMPAGLSRKKRLPFYISVLSGAAVGALSMASAYGQSADGDGQVIEEIIVTGMRASVQSAQNLKRDSNFIQDSIVAEDIGKLPDRSIAEALQRVPGIAVSRFDSAADPEHFAGEGAGVSIRGLTQVRAELNGRDIFSAADGRSLSFDDVPAELMAGVDVIKTPTADMVEGGLGGIVNLRTRMPLDQDGQLISGTVKINYGDVIKEANPEGSILYSNNWDTAIGRLGVLANVSTSTTTSRADNLYMRAYFPRIAEAPFNNPLVGEQYEGETFYAPVGADWRRNDYERKRNGQYIALQWQPNDELEIYATGFQSKATREWFESAFFLDGGASFPDYLPVPVTGQDDWVFDSNNALVSGTMTAPNGIPFGTSSRLSANDSKTADLSLGAKWHRDAWTISADLQRVISSAEKEDHTYGTVAYPRQIRIEGLNSSGGPSIYDVGNYLADLTNYSFGQMMSQPSYNRADSTAVRLDVQYDFEDSLLQSVKSGVRFSEREAVNRSGFSWTARVQPWNAGTWGDDLPTISEGNPLMHRFSFDNFQRGNSQVPVTGWMFTREAMKDFRGTTAAMVAQTPPNPDATWAVSSPNWDELDLSNPANVSVQTETTQAIYAMADFAVNHAFGGNVGLRYVRTTQKSEGYIQYASGFEIPDGSLPFNKAPVLGAYEADYNFLLPSLNLRFNATEELIFRFSASKQIWKPEFWRTTAGRSLDVQWKSEEEGGPSEADRADPDFVFNRDMVNLKLDSSERNPLLEPMTAVQYDLTAEWYFNDAGGMLYAGLFRKDVKDLFRVQTQLVNFDEWSDVAQNQTINVGSADVNGLEIGGTYYFDRLPAPFDGLGISANYTYIDSKSRVPEESGAEPRDTDNSVIGNLPLEGLAENTYNLTLMYEYAGFYARLAYNWQDKVFQSIGPNGWNGEKYGIFYKLPVYADDYAQLDLSMGYDITENFSVNFEAYNLLKADTKGIMRQNGAGDHRAYVYTNDARYGLSLRVTF